MPFACVTASKKGNKDVLVNLLAMIIFFAFINISLTSVSIDLKQIG